MINKLIVGIYDSKERDSFDCKISFLKIESFWENQLSQEHQLTNLFFFCSFSLFYDFETL